MKIFYLGHSSFKLVADNGASVVTDPFTDIGYEMPTTQADCVTISHHHYDHDAVNRVQGNPKIFDGQCRAAYKGFEILSCKCFHDEFKGARRGINYAFKITADGVTVCHLGDLGEADNGEVCKFASGADVLLIPVGGNYTISGAQAAEYVKRICPKIAVPMHYALKGGTIDISGAEQFLKQFAGAESVKQLEVKPCVADVKTQIIIMERI